MKQQQYQRIILLRVQLIMIQAGNFVARLQYLASKLANALFLIGRAIFPSAIIVAQVVELGNLGLFCHLRIDFDPRNAYVNTIDESIRNDASLVEIIETSPDFDILKDRNNIHVLKYLTSSSFVECTGYGLCKL